MLAVVQRAVTSETFGLSPVLAFALLGLMVNRLVDFVRNGFDKFDRIPKAVWLLVAWGLGIVVAFVIASFNSLEAFFGLSMMDRDTAVAAVLAGIGFGSVGGFWHEVMSWLSSATSAATPKGFKSRNR